MENQRKHSVEYFLEEVFLNYKSWNLEQRDFVCLQESKRCIRVSFSELQEKQRS